jgi:hypothetical protein
MSSEKQKIESVYLIFTDVISSCEIDNKGVKNWRTDAFYRQLKHLLQPQNSVALKSIGDALFIVIEGNNTKVKDIFAHLCDAVEKYEVTNNGNKLLVKVRAVMHKINMDNHTNGVEIIDNINNNLTTITDIQDKSKRLTTALDKDIFGIEVNKASRIMSLLTGAAILLTEDVVRAFCEEEKHDYDDILKNKYHSIGNEMVIYSPFPILKLKSFESSINVKSPLKIWHLAKHLSLDSTLSYEYKKRHSFRLLTTVTEDSVLDLETLKNYRNSIIEKLQGNNLFSFPIYTDFFWNVIDYVELTNMDFSREHSNNPNKFNDLYAQKCKNEAHHFYEYNLKFDKQNKFLEFEIRRDENKRKNEMGNTSHLTSLVIDSFSDKDSSQSYRDLYCFNNSDSSSISSIVPQTIDIYKNINITEKKGINQNEETQICNKFLEIFKAEQGRFLLVFFRYFMDEVDNAENKYKTLFMANIPEKNEIRLQPIMKGHIAGLIDSFVIFQILDKQNRDKIEPFKMATNVLLDFIFNAVDKRSSNKVFYNYSYPTSIFFLKNNNQFKFNEDNLKYLIKISESKDE